MVSGLTPPSKRDDINKLNEEIQGLRDGIRFTSPPRNTGSTMGSSVGGGGSTIVPAIKGLFALTPSDDVMSVKLTYTFTSNQEDLVSGDEVTSSSNGWKGTFVKTESELTSGTTKTYVAVFKPSDSSNPTFVEGAQNLTKSGFTAAYTLTSVSQKTLVLSTSCCIIGTVDSQNPDIQNINGTVNDGQILFVKPKEGKSLTLETGGNIDISSNVTVADNEFAILQYFEDAGNKYLVISGGSSGSNSLNANQTLSNLTSPTAVNQSLIPDGDEVEDLGQTSNVWRRLYAKDIYSTGTIRTEASDDELEFYAGGAKSFAISRSSSAPFTGVAEVWGAGSSYKTMSNTAGAANAEIGGLHFDGYDSAVNRDTFASMTAVSTTVTSGLEEALIKVKIKKAGATVEMLEVNPIGIRLPTASSTNPVDNGTIFLSGSDVKIRSGGNNVNISSIGGSTTLAGLSDTVIGTPNSYDVLRWTGATWSHGQVYNDSVASSANIDLSKINVSTLGIDTLSDVVITGPVGNGALIYDTGTSKWVNTQVRNDQVSASANIDWSKLNKTGSVLNDIDNVTITSPATDSMLKWNGSAWVDGLPSHKDGMFMITNSSDSTKTIFFNLAGHSSGADVTIDSNATADRTLTLPNATTTLAGLDNAQTFTAIQSFDANIDMNGNDITDVDDISFSTVGMSLTGTAGSAVYIQIPAGQIQFSVSETSIQAKNPLDMNDNKITDVADPTNPQDAATRAYVLANAGGSGATQALDNLAGVSINSDMIPDISGGRNLGGSSYYWGSGFISNSLYFGSGTSKKIQSSATNDLTITVPSGGDIEFDEAGTKFFHCDGGSNEIIFARGVEFNQDTLVDGGKFIRSHDATECGFSVASTSNVASSVGTEGTIQIPRNNGFSGTGSAADNDFGDGVGCIGIMEVSNVPHLCIRNSSGWWYMLTGNRIY